jgi:hypothetical protein
VVASASNGHDVTELAAKITRQDPVLTTAQLVVVVRQPWWGTALPHYFTTRGAELKPYSAAESAVESATPSAAPTDKG